jgi:uncharacterized protein (DUF1810 family)
LAEDDPYDLQRFVDAQAPVYDHVLRELSDGHKTSHWMWFVFPQIAGLGFSSMSARYAISGKDEAVAYAEHAVLGQRLRECTGLVNAVEGRTALEVFGRPDDLKFRSSMTLFSECAAETDVFRTALAKYFDGKPDSRTLALLRGS